MNKKQKNLRSELKQKLKNRELIFGGWVSFSHPSITEIFSEINLDLSSSNKMFRLLQGDVGSGKTIVSLLAALNTINSGFQVALMAPTEILAKQHFNLAKKVFPKDLKIEFISGKSEYKDKKIFLIN